MANPILDLVTGVDSSRYNYGDPSKQTSDIEYLNKLRAMRQARESGAATQEQIAPMYKATTGRDIGASIPANTPYEQLRARRQVAEQIATKPVSTVPSSAVQPKASKENPFDMYADMKPGDIRYIDPRTKQLVATNDVTQMAKERAASVKQEYIDRFNAKYGKDAASAGFRPFVSGAPQSMADLQKQGDIAKQQYDEWRAKVDAQPFQKIQANYGPVDKTARAMRQQADRAYGAEQQAAGRKFAGEQAGLDRASNETIAKTNADAMASKAAIMAEARDNPTSDIGKMTAYRQSLLEAQQNFAPAVGKDGKPLPQTEAERKKYDEYERLINETDVNIERLMGAKGGGRPAAGAQPSGQNAEAVEWARKNPNDPRSAAILAKLGIKA